MFLNFWKTLLYTCERMRARMTVKRVKRQIVSYSFYENYFTLMDPPKGSLGSSGIPRPHLENGWPRKRLGLLQQDCKKEIIFSF